MLCVCVCVSHTTQIGVIEDTENRERLAKLLRFHSSKEPDALTSLTDYVSRMKEGQKAVYYMAADNVQVRDHGSAHGSEQRVCVQIGLLGHICHFV